MSLRRHSRCHARRPSRRFLGLAVALLAFSAPVGAQQRPLRSEDPRLVEEGAVVLESGLGYFSRARFPVSGIGGDELSVYGGLHVGLGRAEFQITGDVHDFLWIHEGGEGRTSDWGDAMVSTKIALRTESGPWPDIGFQTSVVLPNASNESGLGTDGTHFFARILLGRSSGPVYVFGNLGLGILDDATRAGAQEDVLVYGVAATVGLGPRLSLAGEITGRENAVSDPTPGSEDRRQVRMGLRWQGLGLDWDVAATAGLTSLDPRVGVVIGTTKRFTLW